MLGGTPTIYKELNTNISKKKAFEISFEGFKS